MEWECMRFDYSWKNIPICNKQAYTIKLFDMTNKFIDRMRWKAFWFENPATGENEQKNYKFPTRRSGPRNDKLVPFEEDLFNLIKSIKFRKIPYQLQ